MRKKIELKPDYGDCGIKKSNCGGAYGEVWQIVFGWNLQLGCLLFLCVRLAEMWLQSSYVLTFNLFCKKKFINVVLSVRFAKIILQ
jgi:hypothetical protein